MALTLAQLITRIEDNAGRADQSDAQCVDWLNDGLREMARRHDWRDLHVPDYSVSLTEDTYRYTFPTDMKTCHGIRLIDGSASKWLIEKTRYWLNQYEPYPDDMGSGRPSYYCVDGNTYDVIPLPDDDYTAYLNYSSWATEFDSGTTTAEADITNVDDVLIAYGTAELFRKLGQDDRANHWEAVFERRFRRARTTDGQRPMHLPQPDGVIRARRLGLSGDYWHDPEVG